MTVQELNVRLKSLSQVSKEVSQLSTKLSKLSDQEGDEERVELSAEIHQSLKEAEEEFEIIKQEVEDVTSSAFTGRRRDSEKDRERLSLVANVGRLGEDLKLARIQFRKAQLQAKRNAEAVKRKERELLFADVQEGSTKSGGRKKGQEKFSQDEQLVNAASDVTSALRRTHQLMQSELQRSQFARETLQQSTAALSSLNESYSTLDNLLSSSKSLISTLVSSQKSDTWYLETAFWILVYTIIWLVFRRLFYGPIRYLFFLPTKWVLQLFYWTAQIIIGVFVGSAGAPRGSASPSRTLIVQPSATGRAPKFAPNMAGSRGIPVGAGGLGAKSPSNSHGMETPLSDKVVAMAEETVDTYKLEDNNKPAKPEASKEPDKKAEGEYQDTGLREKKEHDAPNPMKRMWEEPIVDERQARDEL